MQKVKYREISGKRLQAEKRHWLGEVFAYVAQLETIKLMASLVVQHRWKIYQLDVKLAFLNGFLEENIDVEQPLGYVEADNEGKVHKFKKALYSLKQASHAWNTKIYRYFQENEFEKYP